ncbi:MAG: CHAT domain-containing protein [Blastocatellales bacterium]
MTLQPEQEDRIRRYLLGGATPDETAQVESDLLRGDESVERLLLIEDELIADYARGALTERESALLKKNFFITPERRERLIIAREMVKEASAYSGEPAPNEMNQEMSEERAENQSWEARRVKEPRRERATRMLEWVSALLRPDWKIAIYTALAITMGFGIWSWHGESDIEKGLIALNQAYSDQRPLEARITGFSYAPPAASARRGKVETLKVNQIALDRAKTFILGQSADDSDPAVLHALGQYYLTQKEFDTAVDQFGKALNSGDDSARLRSDLGAALLGRIERDRAAETGRSNKDVNDCLTHLNKALQLDPAMPEALFNRAVLYQSEQLHREARADWEDYLRLDPNSRWSKEAETTLGELEQELREASQRNERLYQNFSDTLQARQDKRALQALSLSYSFNGNYVVEQTIDRFLSAKLAGRESEAAEKLKAVSYAGKLAWENAGDRFIADLSRFYGAARLNQLTLSKRARELMAEANGFYRKAENDCAVELYEQARQLFARAGNSGEALFAEAWIGHCHHQRSDTERNLQIFTKLVPVCAERKYRWMQANALCGLANAHNSLGQFSQAIADCRRCGEIAGDLGDQIGVMRSSYMLGFFYYQLGKHDENLRISERGRHIADEISAEIRYAITFYNLPAWSLSELGLHEAAFAFQREAVKMAEESKSSRLRAYAYIYQGLLFARHRKFSEATASVQQGIAIGRELKNDATGQDITNIGRLHLGHIYREAENYPEAMAAFNQVIEFYRHGRKQAYFYGATKGRLLTLIAQGDDAGARVELERTLGLYEDYRKSIQEESNRNSFFDQEQGIYDVAIDFAKTRLNNPRQAFAYAELSRARSLRDAITRGWEMTAGPEYPDLRIKAGAAPRGIDQIQQQIPDNVQLLEYAALKDKLVIWLISKTGVEDRVVSISLAELKERVNQYLTLVNQPPGKTDQQWREKAMELYDILIRPIEPLLDGRKQICVIPDKILTRLPFGALVARSSGRLLVENHLLSYASSSNVFLDSTERGRLKSSVASERLLAVGNPRFDRRAFPSLDNLSSAKTEAISIADSYASSSTLVEEKATKSAVLRGIERADVAHLALHYTPDPWSPMLSRMPLASAPGVESNSVLQMYELYRLKELRPRLVVLSACQTRGEEYLGGEGALGITRPFEAAGIPLVVASLWSVDTDATSDLMISFHRERKRSGRPTAEALRAAQLELINRAGNYRHPYYWAAFILVGGYSDY